MIDRSKLDEALARVPGMMDRRELELLYTLASRTHETIVELGAFAGLSTIALCLGAQSTGAEVVTVDAFTADIRSLRRTLGQVFAHSADRSTRARWSGVRLDPERALRENLRSFGVSARIIRGYSWAAAEQVDGPVGLLFVDADHTRAAIERDLAAWTPKLGAEAVVAFDDYIHDQWTDVVLVANEWAAQHARDRMEVVGKVAVFRRGQNDSGHGPFVDSRLSSTPPPEAVSATAARTTSTSSAERHVDDPERHIQAYLRAFSDRDLDACLRAFADDATITFVDGPWQGPAAIEQWHRKRFDADVRLTHVGQVRLHGGTVEVDLNVISRTLRDWHIASIPVRVKFRMGRPGIEKVAFGLKT